MGVVHRYNRSSQEAHGRPVPGIGRGNPRKVATFHSPAGQDQR